MSTVPQCLQSSSGPLAHQKRGKSSLWPHMWGDDLMVFSEITFKCIDCKRFLSLCHWRYQAVFSLTLIGTQLSQERNLKSVPGWKRFCECVFFNNGHIKVKLLTMFLNTEGKPALFGFSFSVPGAALIPGGQFHHRVGAEWTGDKTKMESIAWEFELTWKANFFILGGAAQIPSSRGKKKLNWFRDQFFWIYNIYPAALVNIGF